MKIFTTLSLFILLQSCGFVARKGYGAKKPKIENERTILSWLFSYGFDTNYVMTTLPENYYDLIPGLPQAPLLFDNQSGNFLAIGFSNGKYCPQDVDKSFAAIPLYRKMFKKPDSLLISEVTIVPPGVSVKDKEKYEIRRDTIRLHLPEISKKLASLTGTPIVSVSGQGNDYTLLLPFALFLGKRLQVEDLKKFYLSAKANTLSKIHIVFLNLDKQEWWGDEWNRKININF